MDTSFLLLALLACKHYVADFLVQPAWMLAGKGNLARPGGYAHAGLHGILTFALLFAFKVPLLAAAVIAGAEIAIHFIIDFGKSRMERTASEAGSRRYWALHGADQLLHQLTYLAIVAITVRHLA